MKITPRFYFGMGKGCIHAGIITLLLNVILYHVNYYDADVAITVTKLSAVYVICGIFITETNSSK